MGTLELEVIAEVVVTVEVTPDATTEVERDAQLLAAVREKLSGYDDVMKADLL